MPITTKPNVFGTTSAPKLAKFSEPALEDTDFHNINLKDEHGNIVLVTVTSSQITNTAKYGPKPTVKADIRVYRPKTGATEVFKDQLLFGTAIVDQLTPLVGQGEVAAKVFVSISSYGTLFPKVVEPSDEEVAAASAAFEVAPY